jgi:hypothetical protein
VKFRLTPTEGVKRLRRLRARMRETTLNARTVIGDGAHRILVEPKGGSIRVKMRGRPEFFVPLDVAQDLGAVLTGLARQSALVRA